MGREIGTVILDTSNARLALGSEIATHALIGQDYGTLLGRQPIGVPIVGTLDPTKIAHMVVISFPTAEAVQDVLDAVAAQPTARLVIGTTGLKAPMVQKIHDLARTNPVVYSPNMSLGVNLLFHITAQVSKALAHQFDVEIIEAHHRLKKDAPSGTAVRLGEIVAAEIGKSYDEAIRHGRVGMVGERTSTEVGMHAVRGGDIVGDHTVLFAGDGERLELRHMAHSRKTFAKGAVTAALWLADKKPGLYTMHDVLGLA